MEVIHQHAYEKSTFLRGAAINESKVLSTLEEMQSEPMAYINPQQPHFHFLDNIISFDPEQAQAFILPCPVIMIGSAGSGKTALTLEKMKEQKSDIAYITHSPYLAQHSRALYYTRHHANENDEERMIDFLSYREFLETIAVPKSQEINFRVFAQWLRQVSKGGLAYEPHKLYEEFKGVLSGTEVENAYLTEEAYYHLGIKQSIYSQAEKEQVYALYRKYLQFLRQNQYYDTNLISYEYQHKATPRYDFLVVDEVQDFTNIQLALLLKTLKHPHQFFFCGDSNQIVHPNFFSWAKIKTFFYHKEEQQSHHITRILQKNYPCAKPMIALGNRLLRIKNARFGSIDQESNYLMEGGSDFSGGVTFLASSDKNVSLLNEKSLKSTKYAVIVIRDEVKEKAKQHFNTPLIFSIHEAKGLEYDNIILYDFIATEPKAFLEIIRDVSEDDLAEVLSYRRSKDKADRSLEMYKFYINALYVALTRGIKQVYWVESLRTHPLLDLLHLKHTQSELTLDNTQSSLEDWQREARKLELQGKEEQAKAIRSQVLKQKTVPWEVLTPDKVTALKNAVLAGKANKEAAINLLEYALIYHDFALVKLLKQQGVKAAFNTEKCWELIQKKYYASYTSKNIQIVMQQIQPYGIDVRNTFNQTALMAAVCVGNEKLVNALLESGANIELTDNANNTAFHLLLQRALFNQKYAMQSLQLLYEQLAADTLDIQIDDKLVKIHCHKMEYLLFHLMYVLLTSPKQNPKLSTCAINAPILSNYLQHFPENVLLNYRKKRAYISSILSTNEAHSGNPRKFKLFMRV